MDEIYYVNNTPAADFYDAVTKAAAVARAGLRDGVVHTYKNAAPVTVAVIRAASSWTQRVEV